MKVIKEVVFDNFLFILKIKREFLLKGDFFEKSPFVILMF